MILTEDRVSLALGLDVARNVPATLHNASGFSMVVPHTSLQGR